MGKNFIYNTILPYLEHCVYEREGESKQKMLTIINFFWNVCPSLSISHHINNEVNATDFPNKLLKGNEVKFG